MKSTTVRQTSYALRSAVSSAVRGWSAEMEALCIPALRGRMMGAAVRDVASEEVSKG